MTDPDQPPERGSVVPVQNFFEELKRLLPN